MDELEMLNLLRQAQSTSKRVRITFKEAEGLHGIPTLVVMGQTGEIALSDTDVQALSEIFAVQSWGDHNRAFEFTLRESINEERFLRDLLPACEGLEVI